jgi:hypothetical protein
MAQDPLAASLVLLLASLTVATGLLSLAPRPWTALGETRRLWSIALLFAPVGWMMLELGHLMNLGLLAIAAKIAISLAFVVFLAAVANLRGMPLRWRWAALPVLGVAAASLWVYWNAPYAPMRTGLLSLICAGLALGIAALASGRRTREHCPHAPWLALAFLASGLLLLLRGVFLLAPPSGPGLAAAAATNASLLLGAALAIPLLATLFLMLGVESRRVAPRGPVDAAAQDLRGG